MQINVSIEEMVNSILTLLGVPENNFAPSTIQEHESTYGIILSNLKSKDIQMYDKDIVEAACNELCQQDRISKTRRRLISNALNKLDYYYKFQTLQPRHYSRSGLECLNKDFEQIVSNYLEYCRRILSIKENTAQAKRVYAVHFMNYLSLRGIQPRYIDGSTVTDYLVSVNKKIEWTETTKNTNMYRLRQFLSYLVEMHGASHDSVSPLHVIFGYHKVHLPAYYEPVEVMTLVNIIDVSSPKGKRDYLICLLVSQLGMRAGDVSRLTFSSIHWDRKTIEIIQQKTGNPLVLPLLGNLRFALLDYWKNARPECNNNTILLTQSKPHRCLSNSFLAGIVTERLQKASIDISNRKHGCHSMRHSLARNLLSENEALSTITGILGHKNSNTTRKYLGIDTKGLRNIALEVPYGRK